MTVHMFFLRLNWPSNHCGDLQYCFFFRKACAEREMGLGEERGMCRDRNEWRRMTDRIV